MFAPFLARLRRWLTRRDDLRERLEALEAAHAALAQEVRETLEDRLLESDKTLAKVRSALGRIYRLKGWDESDEKEAAAATGKPDLAAVMAAKFRGR